MQEVKGLIERHGGKLIAYYMTLGEYDWLLIYENANPLGALAGLATGAAGGGTADLKTTVGFTTADAEKAFEMAHDTASAFRSAGG